MALDRIGALWRKSKEGGTYFTGQVELIKGQPVRIVVMPFIRQKGNVKKSTGEDPAYRILLATDDEKTANQKPVAVEEAAD